MPASSNRRRSEAPEPGKRARTRAKLIDAAAAVIAERGFDRASLAEIAARAGMTRGAVYGNFKDKDEIFLAVIKQYWDPIIPPLEAGLSLRENMRILGSIVAREARRREPYAAAATSFQLYVLTHEHMRSQLTRQNAVIYKSMAKDLIRVFPEQSLPMPAERFIRVLDALITGLLFTYFQSPALLTEEVFVSAFEALA